MSFFLLSIISFKMTESLTSPPHVSFPSNRHTLMAPLIIILSLFLFFPIAEAEIFKYTDEKGDIYFTDSPKEFKKNANHLAYYKTGGELSRIQLERVVEKYSTLNNLEPALVKAVIEAESSWNPNALSPKGAVGLMQLMPATSKLYSVKDPRNPVENINGGIKYLRYLLDRFDNNIKLALAAYNAGPETVERYGGVPPYNETKAYIRKVIAKYKGEYYYPDVSRVSGGRSSKRKIYKVSLPDGRVLYTNVSIHGDMVR